MTVRTSEPIEVGYGKARASINVLVGVIFFGGGLLVVESVIGRAAGILCLSLALLTVGRILNPRPQVLIGDESISVGGRWTSAVGGRRRARWENVRSVGPVRLSAPFDAMQQGRVPTYPDWWERVLPREFWVEQRSGRRLIVREPLDRSLDEVRALVQRWVDCEVG